MAPAPESLDGARRLMAGVLGALLGLGAYFYSRFAFALVVHRADGAVTCLRGYHCPGKTEGALVTAAFAVTPLAALVMTIAGAFGLLRYAFGGPPPRRRVALAAVAGPVLAVAMFFALIVYGGWVGAFS